MYGEPVLREVAVAPTSSQVLETVRTYPFFWQQRVHARLPGIGRLGKETLQVFKCMCRQSAVAFILAATLRHVHACTCSVCGAVRSNMVPSLPAGYLPQKLVDALTRQIQVCSCMQVSHICFSPREELLWAGRHPLGSQSLSAMTCGEAQSAASNMSHIAWPVQLLAPCL